MDLISKELGINQKNICSTPSPGLFSVLVHTSWLKRWMKNSEVDSSVNNADFTFQVGESVPYPWRKIFLRVINKKTSKVLPLPRYKLNETNPEYPLTFPQLLQYISLNNQRNLWKETFKKYCQNNENSKESTIVNLVEHDQLLTEVLLRLYGCNIIKLKNDSSGKLNELKELSNKQLPKSYETHGNILAAMFCLESDNNFFVIYRGHYDNNLLDCLNFSPNLIDINYSRGLFIIYQLLSASKAMSDRGLSLGLITLQDIYLTENLWLQIVPAISNNIHCLDASLIYELNRIKQSSSGVTSSPGASSKREEWGRSEALQLEKLCMLWVRGRISNLDYLLHLNTLAGRTANDPQAHLMVPWVTDFSSRCGRNWRDLSKSKYRLNKGDRQLDMTYDVTGCGGQIAHHVSDALSDITCYVYLARRTPKEILCKHVRNKWVPAEYPASIQRMQEWTPDECIPEFYTDPTVFKSIHEDLPDLGIPTWATCVEDFIMKHREALESTHVSEHLHHWIDITFGYKLSGTASVKAKNVCLSLVDGHTALRRGGPVQLFPTPHPPRAPRPPPPAPPRLFWTPPKDHRKLLKTNDSSDDGSDEEEESTSLPQHVSRLSIPTQRVRPRHKSTSRARSLSKSHDTAQSVESRASSHSRHYRVQKSELGKGIIYLPKEFNPVAPILAMENLDNFRSKCFFSKAEDKDRHKENVTTLNLYPMDLRKNTSSDIKEVDATAYTNHMFQATYDQSVFKKFSQDAQENVFKERKNRNFNNRYTTDAVIYKQFVTESRRQDMLVIGCLIVEIFLHNYMRPLRTNSDNFIDRFNSCRIVLKHNFFSLPKCVSYIASLILNVQAPSLSFKNDLNVKTKDEPMKKTVITDKGLPSPTPSQLLQPLLMQHLIPFPQSFNILYKLLSTLHEYELSSNELNILYTYDCDGTQCSKYQDTDKTKVLFAQRIAEGKIQACSSHLEVILSQVTKDQFDVLDIFVRHYIELLKNRDTSVLAAWYLFDTVSKALGPAETKNKLLRHLLNLYDDDELLSEKPDQHKLLVVDATTSSVFPSKQKFVKLYHHIFLLQLMVRLGLQCFLDNFTQHLVEAVGGYKDFTSEVGSPGHMCRNRSIANKKPRYSDDNLKSALSTTDIFSPDTSYGSEHVMTPSLDKSAETNENRDKDLDNRSENDLFHFETEKDRLPSRSSRSKSPAGSISSVSSANQQDSGAMPSPSPSVEYSSPVSAKYFSPNMTHSVSKDLKEDSTETLVQTPTKPPMSPTIDIPNRPMFTSYLHFADEDAADTRKENQRSVDEGLNEDIQPRKSQSQMSESEEQMNRLNDLSKISDMSLESLNWLAHRLGPVLTCRYITRNLLKMLTLCYIGKENLAQCDSMEKDEFDEISVVPSKVVGDKNAAKVIRCLTSIVAMYGEQLIIFQYLPHMGELIASCRRRLSVPLEGGVVACLQLIKYLLPHMSDVKVMEQLQDTFLKSILQPCLRLCSTSRCSYPSGASARCALLRKLVDALYAIALRIGPEMTRRQLCVPALQRYFLAFDKATGKVENWPKQDECATEKSGSSALDSSGYLELCRDGRTLEWRVLGGVVQRADLPDLACSPPAPAPPPHFHTAQEELLIAFNDHLAYKSFYRFANFIGTESMERCLKNYDNIRELCRSYETKNNIVSSSPLSPRDLSFTDSPLRSPSRSDRGSVSGSGGWSGPVVGNRLDAGGVRPKGGEVVAFTPGNSQRHLRGDWLIYWEHEIGRPEKDTRFNLKQIKLQTFVGHTHTVKSICCLDNENSFMTGSKDKTVKLWSLRNQGDGNATTQCNWTYTGHKKGVLSLSFIESMRLAVSTDSVVHIWDPFMESVVSQLDNIKVPVSIVRTMPGPSTTVIAATTDATLRIIDARCCNYTHELKLGVGGATFVRCVCACPWGRWAAAGLAGGHVAVLDARTGRLRAAWRAHDNEVLKMTAVDEHRLITSGLDQVTALWNVDDGELIAHLKGNTEPVHCLSVYYNELISGTTNNRIGVHTSLDQDASFSSTKLRSDTFKGVLTSMAVLPLNRLLLLGSDNGTVSLLC